MTNDFNDLDHNELGHEEVPQKTGVGANLAEAWRSRPLFKLMVIMIVVAAVVGVCVSLFSGGSNNNGNTSTMVRPPDMHEPPGGPVSPDMRHQVELANAAHEQNALNNGTSSIPIPIGHSADIGDLSASNGKSDELKELEAELERQKQQIATIQQPQQPQQQQAQQPQQFDDTLAQAMQHQMTQLMDSWTPHGIKEVTVTKIKAADDSTSTSASTSSTNSTATAANSQYAANAQQTTQVKTIVPAGTVSYAQLLTEANSDVPGPILAQIVSGPLAGARAVGSFQVANGYSDYLVLQFSLATLKGHDYTLNAIALDPDTTLGGLATEVDQRYFTRVILPAAAGFLQGFGASLGTGNSSISTSGDTTIVTQSGHGISQGMYTGLAQGAQTMSQFFQNQANQTKPLVRVAAGTPIGMFFVSTVTDQNLNQMYPNGYPTAAGYPQQTPGYGIPGTLPYGTTGQAGYYPGMTTAGYGGQTQNVPYPNYGSTSTTGYTMGGYPGTGGYNTGVTAGTPFGAPLYGH